MNVKLNGVHKDEPKHCGGQNAAPIGGERGVIGPKS